MELTREQGNDLAFDELEGWETVECECTKHRRWASVQRGIYRHTESGKYYEMIWDCGLTESQDVEPFEYQDPVLKEVALGKITLDAWVLVPTESKDKE